MLGKVVSRFTMGAALIGLFGGALLVQAQDRKWQDERVEYDMYDAAAKATDGNEQVKLLDAWKEKYPETSNDDLRRILYVQAYQKANDPVKLYDACIEMLQLGKGALGGMYVQGLYYLTTLTTSTARTETQYLASGEKYAKEFLAEVQALAKPANVSQSDWDTQIKAFQVAGHTTLGWVAMTQKNNTAAEAEFRTLLKLDSQNAQASYWLGTVILAQRVPAKQFEAMYHFARAGNLPGTGAMAPAARQQVSDYLKKIYTSYHGSEEGLDALVAMAIKSPDAPPDLKIKSKEEIAVEEENRRIKENPELYAWKAVKERLTAADGEAYYQNSVANTLVGSNFRCYLVAQDPPERPETLYLACDEDHSVREVLLKLDQPFRYPAGRGTVIRFQGVPSAFRKEPFLLTIDAEQEQISGWPAAPARQQ